MAVIFWRREPHSQKKEGGWTWWESLCIPTLCPHQGEANNQAEWWGVTAS